MIKPEIADPVTHANTARPEQARLTAHPIAEFANRYLLLLEYQGNSLGIEIGPA